VPRGYALVAVDVRGTGASFGTRDSFRSARERDDYARIAEWVVAQPWSNGRIGATGISYVGAACDFLASSRNPAVRAIAPLSAVWDTYIDHYYPGGLLLNRLAQSYDALMVALDHDRRNLLGDTELSWPPSPPHNRKGVPPMPATVRNVAREKLEQGQLSLGVGVRMTRSVEIAKAMAVAGFDWLFLDMEHGVMSLEACAQISTAALVGRVDQVVGRATRSRDHPFRDLRAAQPPRGASKPPDGDRRGPFFCPPI
jgi:X-Pro dipeptidyl-peptidase (S15 family)